MILTFNDHGDTWDKIITDTDGNVILEARGLKLFPEQRTKEFFDSWEDQLKQSPKLNIVEVVRFI